MPRPPHARLAAALALLAAPAAAFEAPEGCTGVLTVQSADCSVTHVFTCEADPEGWRRKVDFDQDGPTGAVVVDGEYQWLESYGTDRRQRLGEAPDPSSLTTLFETGEDTQDFEQVDIAAEEGAGVSRLVGVDRLTGETLEIDGVPLERTEYYLRKFDPEGELEYAVTGQQYVSRELRLFFGGQSVLQTDGRTVPLPDSRPVNFYRPGDAGFFQDRPLHGCPATDAALRP